MKALCFLFPGLVGLAISYALSVTNLLSGVVTSFTETEKQMVSVERALQYIHGAPQENSSGGQVEEVSFGVSLDRTRMSPCWGWEQVLAE